MEESLIATVNTNLSIVREYLAKNTTKSEMDLPCLQGFLYALTTSTCFIPPSSWLLVVCGGVPVFDDEIQQKIVIKACLDLYQYINDTLTTMKVQSFLIWINMAKPQVSLHDSNDEQIVAFCRGYFKGFLLDPVRFATLATTNDESLLFCLALMKLADPKTHKNVNPQHPQLIDDKMKLTLIYLVLNEYRHWDHIREQGLMTSYLAACRYAR